MPSCPCARPLRLNLLRPVVPSAPRILPSVLNHWAFQAASVPHTSTASPSSPSVAPRAVCQPSVSLFSLALTVFERFFLFFRFFRVFLVCGLVGL